MTRSTSPQAFRRPRAGRKGLLFAAACLPAIVACSSGGDGSGNPVPVAFKLESTNLPQGATWQLNRVIELQFSRNVDLASIDATNVELLDSQGVAADVSVALAYEDADGDGFAEAVDASRVWIVPRGPVTPMLDDTGLVAGEAYTLTLPSGAGAIEAADGTPLEESVTITFDAASTPPLFFDAVAGAPAPVVRPAGVAFEDATSVELDGASFWFEVDPTTLAVELAPAGTELDVDLYSRPGSKPVYTVVLDQPIAPTAANLGPDRVRLEATVPGEGVRPWPTDVTLLSNDVTGAVLLLSPAGGPLPRGGSLEVVLGAGFEDLSGEALLLDVAGFAGAAVRVPTTPGLEPEDELADRVKTTFTATTATAFGTGSVTQVQSPWYSIGAADRRADGTLHPVRFRFDGVDPLDGSVPTLNGDVLLDAPVLGPRALGSASPEPRLVGDTLVLEGATLGTWIFTIGPSENDVFLRTPELLVGSDVELANGVATQRFPILDATYDAAAMRLELVLSTDGGAPADFVAGAVGTPTWAIVARTFRLSTDGAADVLPADAAIAFAFQAVGATADGEPDPSDVVVDWTGDVQQFDLATPGALRWFRWQASVDLDVSGDGIQPGEGVPLIESVCVPFRF